MIRELLCSPHGLLVQGITGRQGQIETRWMLDTGTRVSAGVTPGRAGATVHGVPVYGTVAAAVEAPGNVAAMIYAPPAAAADAAVEAVEAGIRLVVMSAENVPVHRMFRAISAARANRAHLVGPNSQGIIAPHSGRIGCPGGMDPHERFAPGDVGVVSRSGGMASELSGLMRTWHWGTNLQIHIGGSPMVGTRMVDAVRLVQDDPATRRIVVFGEPSGDQEEELADAARAGEITAPVVALIGGRAADTLPAALPFGHAPRAGAGGSSTVASKIERLESSGVVVVPDLQHLREALEAAQRHNRQGGQA